VAKGLKILLGAVIALALLSGAAWGYDRSQAETVAQGVRVSGVDLGGLDRRAATKKLTESLAPRLSHNVEVEAGGRKFYLSPARAGVSYDFAAAVDQAVSIGRTGWIGRRVWRSLSGEQANASVPASVTVSEPKIRAFAKRVAARADHPVVQAHLEYGPDSVKPVNGTPGVLVRTSALASAVTAAFQEPGDGAAVKVSAPVREVQPAGGTKGLADRYPTVVTVSRSGYRLYLFKHLKLVRTFPVAVGMAGLETPAGLYSVQDKQTNPVWHVPNSAWAGALAGKSIPPGPDNPIKARWMGVTASVGIHGTSAADSLGSAASHGCIRMAPVDVIWLYDQVPLGTPVYIS